MSALLVLADSRLPTGGHAHSGGIEAAVAAGRVRDDATLESFLRGRLATAGLVAAAFTAAAVLADADRLAALDAGLDARTPAPSLRRASRAQGRALLRAGAAMWPVPALWRGDPHHPVALGAVAAAAGVAPREAAGVAGYASVSGPASAALRLLGLDPYRVYATLARLAPACDEVADLAVSFPDSVAELPSGSAPLLDISAQYHAEWEVRLFAS